MTTASKELFAAPAATSDANRTATPSRAARHDKDPAQEVFCTANWILSDGRTARSAASIAHCESADESRLRRTFQSLLGRRAAR